MVPDGMAVTRLVALAEAREVGTLLKVTLLFATTESKLVPVIVKPAPTPAMGGEKLVMVGAAEA